MIQPNISAVAQADPVKVPDKEVTALKTNEDLFIRVCTSHAKIALDPGKGGSEEGYTDGDHLSESDLNLQLALAIGSKLELAGYEVVYTRDGQQISASELLNETDTSSASNETESDETEADEEDETSQEESLTVSQNTSYSSDEELSDAQRVAIAKENDCDYLISIQMSTDSNIQTQGFSLFTQPDDKVTDLAQVIAQNMTAINFTQFEGVDNDHYANFPLLYDRSLPSIIINFGYITNQNDYARLSDTSYQEKIGQAITAAFLEQID